MTEQRRAIIVGGAGGIGEAICRQLASQGYRITVADFNVLGAQRCADLLEGEGHESIAIDVNDEPSISAAFEGVESRSPAAILVVATGGPVISLSEGGNILTMERSSFERTIAFNLTGTFSCLQKFTQLRVARPLDHSRVVVIGSTVGQVAGTGPDIGYIASKSALFGFMRQVAFDMAPYGVTVNTVAPGPVETAEFIRKTNEEIRARIASAPLLKRLATPDEVSAGVAYLLSRDADFVTGATLDINGGIYMR